MQRMDFTMGPSAPSMSELKAYEKLFDDDLTTSEAEALDELFLAVSRQSRRRKATS